MNSPPPRELNVTAWANGMEGPPIESLSCKTGSPELRLPLHAQRVPRCMFPDLRGWQVQQAQQTHEPPKRQL